MSFTDVSACVLKNWDGIFLCLEDAVFKDLPVFMSYSALQSCLP